MSSEPLTPTLPGRKPQTRAVAIALVAAALAAGAFFKFRSNAAVAPAETGKKVQPAVAAPTSAEVAVETLAPAQFAQEVRVTGTLKTDETVTVSTKATGLVRRLTVKEGDRVTRGQLLVEIDDRDLQAQRARAAATLQAAQAHLSGVTTARTVKDATTDADLRSAEQSLSAAQTKLSQAKAQAGITATESETRVASAKAGLQSAKDRLKVLRDGARRQETAQAQAAVSRAQAQVNKLKSNLDRRVQLLKDGAIASETVENARRDYEAGLADLEGAKQQLDLVKEGPRGEEIRQAEDAVRQSEGILNDAEANRARRQISDQDIETAQAMVRQAEAARDAARANLGQRKMNVQDIRSAEAAVSQARADIRLMNEQISQTRVYSPVNGVVTKRNASVGESVSQMHSDLLTLVSADTLYLEATAPEGVAAELRQGQPAKITLDAVPGKTFDGSIREIIRVAEGNNRSVRLRISVPKDIQTTSVVGGFARAEIKAGAGTPVLTVPRSAVVSDEGESAVFVVEGGKARRRPIHASLAGSETRVPVLDGLRAGEQVVIEGVSGLTDGQSVAIGKPKPAGPAAAPQAGK